MRIDIGDGKHETVTSKIQSKHKQKQKNQKKKDLSMYQRLYQKHVAVDEEMNLQALLLPVETSKPNKKKHINCNILILSKVVKLD
jgi:hypothetical protein